MKANKKGFTLVENVVAMLILSLLAVTLITTVGIFHTAVTRGRDIQAAGDSAFATVERKEGEAETAAVTFKLLGEQITVSGTTYAQRDPKLDFVWMRAFYPFEVQHDDPPPLVDYIPLTDVPVNSAWPGRGGSLKAGDTFHEGDKYYLVLDKINNIQQDLDHFVGTNNKIIEINKHEVQYQYEKLPGYRQNFRVGAEDMHPGDLLYVDESMRWREELVPRMEPGWYVYTNSKVVPAGQTISLDGWTASFRKLNPPEKS